MAELWSLIGAQVGRSTVYVDQYFEEIGQIRDEEVHRMWRFHGEAIGTLIQANPVPGYEDGLRDYASRERDRWAIAADRIRSEDSHRLHMKYFIRDMRARVGEVTIYIFILWLVGATVREIKIPPHGPVCMYKRNPHYRSADDM